MTKSQNQAAFNAAQDQQQQSTANAQSSYTAAQSDVGDFGSALAKYRVENPYVEGGSAETAENKNLAGTAAGAAQSAQQQLQAASVRSGQNPAGAIAAGEQVAEENARNQMGAESTAEQQRLAGLSGYNANVVNESAKPEEMEQGLMATQLGGANQSLGQQTEAAKQPSFWQELGQAALQTGGTLAGKIKV